MSYYDGGWAPYVPVAQRRSNGAREVAKRMKQLGRKAAPVVIEGRDIASTFWGEAWCENLERYSDFANRMPRGRTYVRNGSVLDLAIFEGRVEAFVAGSELYTVKIAIHPLPASRWRAVVAECGGRIGSLVELLQGRFASDVMSVLARDGGGLFPSPREIEMRCSCPDYAEMCKHVAAVLYGVGARLDAEPALLFTLRKVDQIDLVANAEKLPLLGKHAVADDKKISGSTDLSKLFGIELAGAAQPILQKTKIMSTARRSPPRATTIRRAPAALSAAPKLARIPAAKRDVTLTAAQLTAVGIPYREWIQRGALKESGVEGVYVKTPAAERLIEEMVRALLA